MTERATAFASCGFCPYIVRLTADTASEVQETLRRMLLAHVSTEHPEQRRREDVGKLIIYRGFCLPEKPEAYG
jgi:hypothetical protein